MGWTTTHKDRHIKAEDFLASSYYTPKTGEIIKSVRRGSGVYQAVKLSFGKGAEPDWRYESGETGYVVCFVYMISKGCEDYNFGYKDQTELCGPNIDYCPASVLNLLSPFSQKYIEAENNYAVDWRQRCRARLTTKPAKALAVGDVVCFTRDIAFTSGFTLKANTNVEVVKVKRRRRSVYAFKAPNGLLYRFNGWKNEAVKPDPATSETA